MNIREIIDGKFEIAFQKYASGAESVRSETPKIGATVETIALDSAHGPDSRCMLTRESMDSIGLAANGAHIVSFGIEISRSADDRRAIEDLRTNGLAGNMFYIGKRSEFDYIVVGDNNVRADWLSIEGLAAALSAMRVADSLPQTSLL
jgi:hypothetical protein